MLSVFFFFNLYEVAIGSVLLYAFGSDETVPGTSEVKESV